MDREELDRIARQVLEFKSIIRCSLHMPGNGICKELLAVHPELLYYISSYCVTTKAFGAELRFKYRHQDYPPEGILRIKEENIEEVLRRLVMQYVRKIVLVLPEKADFKGIIKKFLAKSASFYPNFMKYTYIRYHWDITPYVEYELNFSYRIGTVMLKQMELDIVQKLQELKRQLFPIEMPDYVKCFLAHNFLADTVEYCNVDGGSSLERSHLQSACGALIYRKCVCQGYAEAYKRLLDSVGVPCDLVCGQTLDETEGWHAWNIVHLNGGRINSHVDVTWDSIEGRCGGAKTYFLKGDEVFQGKRSWNRNYYTSCIDASYLEKEAAMFCMKHRAELLKHGVRPEWMI